MTVGHGAREDQAGKGYSLIGDGVAHIKTHLSGCFLNFVPGFPMVGLLSSVHRYGGYGQEILPQVQSEHNGTSR
jgi:hypothetical protein